MLLVPLVKEPLSATESVRKMELFSLVFLLFFFVLTPLRVVMNGDIGHQRRSRVPGGAAGQRLASPLLRTHSLI